MSELKLERISHPDAASTSIEIAASGAVSFSNDIAFDTNTFYVDTANGSVGIGTSSPAFPSGNGLHIHNSNSNVARLQLTNAGTGSTGSDGGNIGVDTSGNLIVATQENAAIKFFTVGSEVVRIDSSGNLLVGKTAFGFSTVGTELRDVGLIQATRDGGSALVLNRKTSDGNLLDFYKDQSLVGSIGSAASGAVLEINSGDIGLGLFAGGDQILPRNGSGSGADNKIILGSSTQRFKDLYLSGGVYLGGTGAANKLDDYEEGTWTPVISEGIGSGFTYNEQYGYYTKVGNYVVAYFEIRIGTGTGNGNGFELSGFPFTSSNTISGNGGFAGGFSINDLTRSGAVIYINKNNTIASFRPNTGASISSLSTTDNLNLKYARGVVTYLTDA